MGLWDKIKRFFTGGRSKPSAEATPAAPKTAATGATRRSHRPSARAGAAAAGVRTRTLAGIGAPDAPPVDTPALAFVADDTVPAEPSRPAANPFANDTLLGLSAEEMRRRALRIVPWRTAWIGRVDTIPPHSDLRTALIDRGLVLAGLLTEEQLERIHAVGDEWLRHHEALRLASSVAAKEADSLIAELRQRKAEAKAHKREQAAERRARRAEQVARWRTQEIAFLGPGVSQGLADWRSDDARVQALGLPPLASAAELAAAFGLSVSRLRWLAYHSEAASRTHYVFFEVPKRSGGSRLLAAPRRDLDRAQRYIFENILQKLAAEPPAHGFIAGRSTLSNARPHLNAGVVVNLDLRDFFPSITFRRVRGVFRRLGYSPAVSTILALLCTEAPRRAVELDGRLLFVALGERALPQGACTSPALSNQLARRLDKRLGGMARRHGWTYTRYADDLTFSAKLPAEVGMLMARVRHIVDEEGLALNPKKGRVQRQSSRQLVTGIVVNHKPGLPRREVRRLRAILYNARRQGLAAQNRENIPHFDAWLRGKLAYLQMVDRERGSKLLAELDALTAGTKV